MKKELMGFPNPQIMARDMASNGHWSCAMAEIAGWWVTPHQPTRDAVDKVLKELWGLKQLNLELDEIATRRGFKV